MTTAIICLILLALFFDFLNGFHDSANSIATVVSTKVLSPQYAVIWAAFFNFIAFLFFGTHVAKTIGSGVILRYDEYVLFGALVGACSWNLINWRIGFPTSSTHSLIGGMVGAALANSMLVDVGMPALAWKGLALIASFIFISPLFGLILGVSCGVAVHWIFRKSSPGSVDHIFRKGQLLSAALYSLGHGGNDAQKTMGIIFCLLVIAKVVPPGSTTIPDWVVYSCQAAIALGTLFGGWRIVKTMGQKVAKLRPVDGFCAESGATVTLFTSTLLGIPVSTTHTITGAIMGVGSLKRMSAVKWGVARKIVLAWILTIPCAGLMAAVAFILVRFVSLRFFQ